MSETTETVEPMRTSTPEAEWPFEPILALVRSKINKENPTNKDVARLCGVSERRVRNARELGYINDDYIADRMACKAGTPTINVWPDFDKTPRAFFAGDISEGKITMKEANKRWKAARE